MTATETAQYLRRHQAYNVIGVVNILARTKGTYRGKVNLGRATGARGDNGRCVRPVETARRLGLVTETQEGAALCYTLSDHGRAVRDALAA